MHYVYHDNHSATVAGNGEQHYHVSEGAVIERGMLWHTQFKEDYTLQRMEDHHERSPTNKYIGIIRLREEKSGHKKRKARRTKKRLSKEKHFEGWKCSSLFYILRKKPC